jgi:ABC-type multidrug transport system permease subunit
MPFINQLLPKWEALATLYSVREKPSKIYSWSIFVLANIIAEIPYNAVTGTLFFISWYFGVGFSQPFSDLDKNARGVYQWLMLMSFQMWWSNYCLLNHILNHPDKKIGTFGQAMAALSPSTEVAATFTTLFASFVISFNGVLQPVSQLVGFWHWMYDLVPVKPSLCLSYGVAAG